MEAISTRTGLHIGGRRKGIKLASAEDFFAACEVLEHLREEHVIEYDVISGSDVIVLPARVLNLAAPLLSKTGVKFWEVKVVPLNSLKPEEQAEKRALSHPKRIV
jgi:hypothetical protein